MLVKAANTILTIAIIGALVFAAAAQARPSKPTDVVPTWEEVMENEAKIYQYPSWMPPSNTREYPFEIPPPPDVAPEEKEEGVVLLTREQARKLVELLKEAEAQEVELEEKRNVNYFLTKRVNYLEAENYALATNLKAVEDLNIKIQETLNRTISELERCNKNQHE